MIKLSEIRCLKFAIRSKYNLKKNIRKYITTTTYLHVTRLSNGFNENFIRQKETKNTTFFGPVSFALSDGHSYCREQAAGTL